MTTKLSKLYGMDILTDSGRFIGKAEDFVLDMESGEVSRILLEQLPPGKVEARKAMLQKSILHKNVKSVEDVIVVSRPSPPAGAEG
ncbi:PRC-barrel domain-containing protein [Candidatus Micrarchaeota archaeon]|nr:PRC-barrel domain-containing protein [Candidatus Micrarchaeota archaeon]